MIDALAWVLTVAIARGDMRNAAVFPDETSCVKAGEAWYTRAVDYAHRHGKPKPPGWICMQGEGKPGTVST